VRLHLQGHLVGDPGGFLCLHDGVAFTIFRCLHRPILRRLLLLRHLGLLPTVSSSGPFKDMLLGGLWYTGAPIGAASPTTMAAAIRQRF
jgi:hypothetical protein